MTDDNTAILDAALQVFLRYGFKRSTMGDIAKAAGLSRQSLYARFANKDDVYAAGLVLHARRTVASITAAWAGIASLNDRLDCLYELSLRPTFEMLRANPDAADIIDAAETPSGQRAMEDARRQKIAMLTDLLTPFAPALHQHGQTPADVARFTETALHALLTTADSIEALQQQFASLKAALMALTRPA